MTILYVITAIWLFLALVLTIAIVAERRWKDLMCMRSLNGLTLSGLGLFFSWKHGQVMGLAVVFGITFVLVAVFGNKMLKEVKRTLDSFCTP